MQLTLFATKVYVSHHLNRCAKCLSVVYTPSVKITFIKVFIAHPMLLYRCAHHTTAMNNLVRLIVDALTESSSHTNKYMSVLPNTEGRTLNKIICYLHSLCMFTKNKYNYIVFTRNWFLVRCTRLVQIRLKLV